MQPLLEISNEFYTDELLEQIPEEFENYEPRCPVVVLLDTSSSMQGAKIEALNKGIKSLEEELKQDTLTRLRVEVAIVTFSSSVSVLQDFTSVDEFSAPVLTANGQTLMGEGVKLALSLIETRKQQYKEMEIPYYRPWLFLITDGASTDQPQVWQEACVMLRSHESQGKVLPFLIGVEGADLRKLSELSNKPPAALRGMQFAELFQWLSRSLQAVSQSNPGDSVALPSLGWGSVVG